MDEPLRLYISIRIYQGEGYAAGLNVEKAVQLAPRDFAGMCEILAQFQSLADKIKEDETK